MHFRMAIKILVCVVAAALSHLPHLSFGAQEPNVSSWRARRAALEPALTADLQALADDSEQTGADGQPVDARQIMAWSFPRDVGRQYIFLPTEENRSPARNEIEEKLFLALDRHAERIFGLAVEAANEDAGAHAFQYVHETLHFNPDHARARKILGHRKTDDGWRIAADRLKTAVATRPHPTMNWKPKSYLTVSTPHFNISSQADETTTLDLAEKLERWHRVWRQVFFEFWSRPTAVKRWIDGKGKPRNPTKKFDVIFFADKSEYVRQLSSRVAGIERSTGYYNDADKASYFFASDDIQIQDSWRHESTHQLFQESIRTTHSPFEQQFIWLGEGIAMYFESLDDQGSFATVGGFDARRLQYARVRKLRERYYVELAGLSKLGLKEFQQRTDLARLYSQSAGVAHMLMDGEAGQSQSSLVEFLKLLYRGKLKPDSFEKILGTTYAELDQRYDAFLKVDSDSVEDFLTRPGNHSALAFPFSNLTDKALSQLGACTPHLKWIDLTGTDVTGKRLASFVDAQLTQLFLAQCKLDQETLRIVSTMQSLYELDLSGSTVTNKHLETLNDLASLRVLRLVSTRVDDESLESLAGLKRLETLDVSESRVTNEGIRWLRSQRPQLDIVF